MMERALPRSGLVGSAALHLSSHSTPPTFLGKASWARPLEPEDSRPACWHQQTEQGLKRSGESPEHEVCCCAPLAACLALAAYSGHAAPGGTLQSPSCFQCGRGWSTLCLPASPHHMPCSSPPDLPGRAAAKSRAQAPEPKEPHPLPGPGSLRGQAHRCFHGDVCTLTPAFLHPWPNKEGFQVETGSLKPPLLPCPRWPLPPRRGRNRGPSPSSGRAGGGPPRTPPSQQPLPSPAHSLHSPDLETCLFRGLALPVLPPGPRATSVCWDSHQEPAGSTARLLRATVANPPWHGGRCQAGKIDMWTEAWLRGLPSKSWLRGLSRRFVHPLSFHLGADPAPPEPPRGLKHLSSESQWSPPRANQSPRPGSGPGGKHRPSCPQKPLPGDPT